MIKRIEKRLDLKLVIPLGAVFAMALGAMLYVQATSGRGRLLDSYRSGCAALSNHITVTLMESMARGENATVEQSLVLAGRGDTGTEVFVCGTDRVIRFSSNPALVRTSMTAQTGDPAVLESLERLLAGAVGGAGAVHEEHVRGEPYLTSVSPVRADRRCLRCHTDGKPIRGAVIVRQSLARATADMDRANRISLAIGVAGTLIVLVITYVILCMLVVRPLRRMGEVAEDIAAGNLQENPVEVRTEDEIGTLGLAFNHMVESLRNIISRVTSMSERIAAAAHEISSSTEQMGRAAEEQAAQTSRVAASAEELSTTIIGVARNATSVLDGARESARVADTGGGAVAGMVQGMGQISSAAAASAATVEGLGRRMGRIHEMAGVIDEITYQTKILACNAAIEAARAGEHGKGFAVVADEVKSLAAGTSKSTKDIRAMIQDIQEETGKAVEAIREMARQVTAGSALAGGARSSLDLIVGQADKVTAMVNQIAAATEEQSRAAEDISGNVERIAEGAKANSVGVSQISTATQDLAKQTEDMRQLVGQFRIGGGAPPG